MIRILSFGDVVGTPGLKAMQAVLPLMRKTRRPSLIIVNAENVSGGGGITSRAAERLLDAGADVLTLGDHTWDRRETRNLLDFHDRILRPANFPEGVPGRGAGIFDTPDGPVGVANLMGRVFFNKVYADSPFPAAEKIIKELDAVRASVLDFHAEATSEKAAMAHYLDGRISAVLGTHTHVQTADERILPGGTAFISDLGMCGPFDSIIGSKKDIIIKRFITQLPARLEVADGQVLICGVELDIDPASGRTESIKRIQQFDEHKS